MRIAWEQLCRWRERLWRVGRELERARREGLPPTEPSNHVSVGATKSCAGGRNRWGREGNFGILLPGGARGTRATEPHPPQCTREALSPPRVDSRRGRIAYLSVGTRDSSGVHSRLTGGDFPS